MTKPNMTIPKTRNEKHREAIATLAKLGAVIYFNENQLYHGRAGDGTPWEVDINTDNGGEIDGRRNTFKRSGLYVGSQTVGNAYAILRTEVTKSKQKQTTPELHEVVALDDTAVIYDINFNRSVLSSEDQLLFDEAMQTLSDFSPSEAVPVKFHYREAYLPTLLTIQNVSKNYKTSYITKSQIDDTLEILQNRNLVMKYFKDASDLREFISDISGALNAKAMLKNELLKAFTSFETLQQAFEVEYKTADGESVRERCPLSHEYISAWLANNNIIGIRWAHIKELKAHIFDLKQIMSKKQHGEMLQTMMKNYGEIENLLEATTPKELSEFLINANADEVLAYINQDPNCKKCFDKSAYIAEDWSVGEHTGAVINFFDEYFSKDVPNSVKPLLKIAMLVHDFGKGFEREKGLAHHAETLKRSKYIYDAFEVPKEFRSLIDFIATASQDYTSAIMFNGWCEKYYYEDLKKISTKVFKNSFDREPSEGELEAIKNACIILQSCDSGAYTPYATIHENGKYVKGMNERFKRSFTLNKRGNPRLKAFEPDEPQND